MWQSRRTICFLTMTSTEHRIQAEAETRSPEGLQQRSKASAGSGGRNGLRAPNFNCDNARVNVCASSNESAPKCCAWQHQGGGPETRSGTVQSLKRCPCQQKRAARLPSAAPGSIKEGGGQTKCWQHQGRGGPRNALGHRPEPEVLPLPAETSREAPKCCAWQHQPRNALGHRPEPGVLPPASRNEPRGCQVLHQGKGPRNALGYRPEPEVLPLPAETSREAPKCCGWQHQGGGPRNALGHCPETEVLPLPAETSREAPKCVSSVKRARAP